MILLILAMNNKSTLCWFNSSNISRSSWKWQQKRGSLCGEKGLKEETERKCMKICKVWYKFLTLFLQQFRYKCVLYIEWEKNYKHVSVSLGQQGSSFSSNGIVITREWRSGKICSCLPLYKFIWTPGYMSVYLISKGPDIHDWCMWKRSSTSVCMEEVIYMTLS